MKRRTIAYIYLPVIAMIPIVIGTYQIVHFLNWLLDLGISFVWALPLMHLSLFPLLFCLVISLYEHFCVYYRMVICAVIFSNMSCYVIDYFPSILCYNIANICAIIIIFIGIIGCLVHFGFQIKDFIRYVRTKR